jgi:hypothetical protein
VGAGGFYKLTTTVGSYRGRFFLQKSQVSLDSRWRVWILCVHMCIGYFALIRRWKDLGTILCRRILMVRKSLFYTLSPNLLLLYKNAVRTSTVRPYPRSIPRLCMDGVHTPHRALTCPDCDPTVTALIPPPRHHRPAARDAARPCPRPRSIEAPRQPTTLPPPSSYIP